MQQAIPSSWRKGLIGFFVAGALLIGITQFTIREDRPVAASTVVAVRDVLVEGSPEAANGQVLQLVRYDIPAGITLAMHTHPGMQAAYIESGVLTYTVVIRWIDSGHAGRARWHTGSDRAAGPGRNDRAASRRCGGRDRRGHPLRRESRHRAGDHSGGYLARSEPTTLGRVHAGGEPGRIASALNTYELTPSRRDRLADLTAAWLGCEPDELTIEPTASGRSTPVYRVEVGPLSCFLRLSETPDASLGPEALAHEVLLSYGARVPAVVGYEPFDPVLERSVMLTTAIPGSSLDDARATDRDAPLVAAGADLARINQVPVEGFGWIRRDDPLPTRLTGAFETWDAFTADMTSHPLDDWFDPAMLQRIVAVASIGPSNRQQAVLAHGDFDTSHIFALDGRYSGIIDFGEIRGAEPTFDLGHLALHVPESLPAILQGYASVAPLFPDLSLQIAASAIRIGWFRLTQSSARTNPRYCRPARGRDDAARAARLKKQMGDKSVRHNILTVIYICDTILPWQRGRDQSNVVRARSFRFPYLRTRKIS